MRKLGLLAVMSLSFFSAASLACSFAPGFRMFALSSTEIPLSGKSPNFPEQMTYLIKRGFDDGIFASCSDAGILTIELNAADENRNIGYLITLESGAVEDLGFPEEIIAPIKLDDSRSGFYFVWLDAGTSISARLKVQAVSETGIEGGAIILEVRDR